MNIKRAKEEIEHTVKAYLAKDALGEYAIPAIRQRPILLMGPPGIGKTQVMEQAARECGVALVGLSRTGSYCGNGSGEIVIAFTTANRVPHYSEKALLPMTLLHDDAINPLFRAVAECVEESVLSSLLHAETVTGNHGQTFRSLTELLKNRA